jgi:2'-5' RNA ligase
MRLFVGVDLSPPAKAAVEGAIVRARLASPRSKWVRAEALHLTLVFLGSIPDERVDGIRRSLDAVGDRNAPFEISIGKCDAFGSRSRPRVLWTAVGGDVAALVAMQRELVTELGDVVPPDDHAFTPHITVARSKDHHGDTELARALETFDALAPPAFTVSEIVLYRSETSPTGARYTRVHVASLARVA